MNPKQLIVSIFSMVLVSLLWGQTTETIASDRPGQGISFTTAGKLTLVVQTGVDAGFSKFAGVNGLSFNSNTSVRLGLSEVFELGAFFMYQADQTRIGGVGDAFTHGVSDVQFGAKYNIIAEPKGWIPGLGLQTRVKLPINSKAYAFKYPAPELTLATSHALPANLSVNTFWIVTFNGSSPAPIWKYILNLGFPITGGLSGHVEHYGELTEGVYAAYFDAGLAYLVSPDLQVDLWGGAGYNREVLTSFVSVGLSWRHRLKK